MNSSKKIYTDILENITETIKFNRQMLSKKLKTDDLNEAKLKKMACETHNISLSTYNKYLRELKNGTYERCERETA